MFLAGSADRWHWSEDAFPPVAYCVHALVHDGLRVPPFDQHLGGDGSLTELGLDAPTWRRWLASVLGQQATLSAVARELGGDRDRAELRSTALAAAEVLRRPGSFCPGASRLQQRLDDLWVAYEPTGEAWKRRMTVGEEGVRHRLAPSEQRRLWQALLPFHDRLPTISVFLVAYPRPVVMPLPPTTCLIAPERDAAGYARQVVAAAGLLVAAT